MDLLVQNNSCEWNQVIACALSCLTSFVAKCSQVLSSWRHGSVVPWFLWQVTLLSRSAARLSLYASGDGLLSDLYSWPLGRKVQSMCMFLSWHMLAFLLVTHLPLVGPGKVQAWFFANLPFPLVRWKDSISPCSCHCLLLTAFFHDSLPCGVKWNSAVALVCIPMMTLKPPIFWCSLDDVVPLPYRYTMQLLCIFKALELGVFVTVLYGFLTYFPHASLLLKMWFANIFSHNQVICFHLISISFDTSTVYFGWCSIYLFHYCYLCFVVSQLRTYYQAWDHKDLGA